MRVYFEQNSMVLTIDGLKNERTGEAIVASSGVAVTADLLDKETSVPLASSPITLNAVSGSPGKWQGTFSSAIAPPNGAHAAVVRITADGGEFLTGHWEIPVPVRDRQW